MAWQADHKNVTRQRILSSASRLFSLNGYEDISINQVMADAGLTRGAFYSHFKSKSELHAKAIMSSANEISTFFSSTTIDDFIKSYLSKAHKEGEFVRCPLAFMIGDITQRDSEVRDTYTKVFKGFVNNLVKADAEQNIGDEPENKYSQVTAEALQKAVLLIGGMTISRAINDDKLADQVLAACQSKILE